MLFKRANIFPAYLILFFSLTISLTAFTIFFIDYQRNLLIEREREGLNQELLLVAEFVREDFSAERYQNIEQFFQLWGAQNPKLYSAQAVAINGFILARFKRSNEYKQTLKLKHTLTNNLNLTLVVEFNLDKIEQDIKNTTYLIILANSIFIILLMALLWFIMQRYLIKPLRNSENKFINLAAVDTLTKINNRRAFFELSERERKRCFRYQRPLTMLLLDLDHFKHVNDNFGHQVGDHILQLFTAKVQMVIRETDILGRLGGEEFAICLPELDLSIARLTAERIRHSIEQLPPLEYDQLKHPLTVSIGITQMSGGDDTCEAMLCRCDKALYQAKADGRNCVRTLKAEEVEALDESE